MLKSMSIALTMFFWLCLLGNGYAGEASANTGQVAGQEASSEQCLAVDGRYLSLPCVKHLDGKYYFNLEHVPSPFDTGMQIWKTDMDSIQVSQGEQCIDLHVCQDSGAMGLFLPCVSFMGIEYEATLDYYFNASDPSGIYWLSKHSSAIDGVDPLSLKSQNILIKNKLPVNTLILETVGSKCMYPTSYPVIIPNGGKGTFEIQARSSGYGCFWVHSELTFDIYKGYGFDKKAKIATMLLYKEYGGKWRYEVKWHVDQVSISVIKPHAHYKDWIITVESL